MRYKGIIFDKDGTLFDYYAVWGPVFRKNIDYILKDFGRSDDHRLRKNMLYMLGIGDDGINPDGLIFKHNGALMLVHLFLFSKRNHIPYKQLIEGFKNGYYDSQQLIKESLEKASAETTLIPLFTKLKQYGYMIGIATSDNSESTSICLSHFGIEPFVDMVTTYDDHYKKKPNPESLLAFCRRFSLQPSELVVVGDASVDMKYARRGKAGYRIGVLTGSRDIKRLSRLADIIYPSIIDLINDPTLFPHE